MIAETSLRQRDYPAGATMALHAHPADTLSIVVGGDFIERVGGGERGYARGHVAFLPAGHEHAQAFGANGARQVTFEPRRHWVDYLTQSRVALSDGPFASGTDFGRLGDRLVAEMRRADDHSEIACEGLMLEILAAFGRREMRTWSLGSTPSWLAAARDYIHENVCEPVSLAEVAAAVGRHEIHLAREFRRRFGVPVLAYQRRLRIERAVRLLKETRLALTEIALDCGFSSHAHFCREFGKQLGVSPSGYRREQARLPRL
jgi:AraC family transcriptional regulator